MGEDFDWRDYIVLHRFNVGERNEQGELVLREDLLALIEDFPASEFALYSNLR